MRWQLLVIPFKWLLFFGSIGGLLFGLFWLNERTKSDPDDQERIEKRETDKKRKDSSVSLEEEEAERYGLEVEAARAVQWYEQATVYGRVVPNPQATAEMRSPFAGTLCAAENYSWPALGQRVKVGQTLGWVDVRVGPEIKLDFQNKLSDARIRQRGAEEEVKLQQDRADSLKGVTSQQILSRVELDNALIQLAQAKNQLATARAAAELWQKALEELEHHKGNKSSAWRQPLTTPADGEITDLAGKPGMAVEAGGLVLEVVDFRRPLVRLDIPPESLGQGGPPQRIEVELPPTRMPLSGTLNPPSSTEKCSRIEASLVGPAPRANTALQFVSYWYEVRPPQSTNGKSDGIPAAHWRPGLQVVANLRSVGTPALPAVSVPASAVLYHEGRPFVYIRTQSEKYERREVRLLGREGDRWIVAVRQGGLPVGAAPGESVVSHQAQVLLSKEFLAAVDDD